MQWWPIYSFAKWPSEPVFELQTFFNSTKLETQDDQHFPPLTPYKHTIIERFSSSFNLYVVHCPKYRPKSITHVHCQWSIHLLLTKSPYCICQLIRHGLRNHFLFTQPINRITAVGWFLAVAFVINTIACAPLRASRTTVAVDPPDQLKSGNSIPDFVAVAIYLNK